MVFIIVPLFAIGGILLSKFLLKKWINHLSAYCIIWSGLILLYEMKLLPYVNVIPLAWLYIFLTFITFLLGILTITTAQNLSSKNRILENESEIQLKIFADRGKVVKYSVIFFSFITLLAAIQNWMVLFKLYGSIPGIILHSNEIYHLSIHNEIKGIIPYISYAGYVAIFFSGIYTAYKKKFVIVTFLPFIGVILKEIAIVGRAGMLFALIEFLITFILFRHLLVDDKFNRFKFVYKNGFLASGVLILLFVISASFVRISRDTGEDYANTSLKLRHWKENVFITPTIYLYLSSDVGVLSKYLESGGKFNSEEVNTQFGVNTFLSVYNLLSKFGFIDRPENLQRGYYIPMWGNTGTFIRELHADFGISGILIFPYFLGLFITWLWFKFYRQKSLIIFSILVFFNIIIGFSFLVMVTRLLYWGISLVFIIFYIPFLEKLASSRWKSD